MIDKSACEITEQIMELIVRMSKKTHTSIPYWLSLDLGELTNWAKVISKENQY